MPAHPAPHCLLTYLLTLTYSLTYILTYLPTYLLTYLPTYLLTYSPCASLLRVACALSNGSLSSRLGRLTQVRSHSNSNAAARRYNTPRTKSESAPLLPKSATFPSKLAAAFCTQPAASAKDKACPKRCEKRCRWAV